LPEVVSEHRVGDKVRVRIGDYAGARGLVRGIEDGHLEVEIEPDTMIRASAAGVTNYSLAARRAWQTMPKRAGRPRSAEPRRKTLSVRLYPDVWALYQQVSSLGLLPSQTLAVNNWLREGLAALLETAGRGGEPPASISNSSSPQPATRPFDRGRSLGNTLAETTETPE
jgi:hypothetical protein